MKHSVQSIYQRLSARHDLLYRSRADVSDIEYIAHEYAHLLALYKNVDVTDYVNLPKDQLAFLVQSYVRNLRTFQEMDENEVDANAIVHAAFTSWLPFYSQHTYIDVLVQTALKNMACDGWTAAKLRNDILAMSRNSLIIEKATTLRKLLSEDMFD